MSDSFAEVTKDPATEHQKKLARQKKAEAKKLKPTKTFYTIADGKLLKVIFKTNGAYKTYIATKSKMKKEEFDTQVKKWKTEGVWIAEEDYQDKSTEIIEELRNQK